MAKIPLRAYLKEIENLIERGEIEQAIAHGKNILRAYPKHIETYRLLGKAFLESQRYSEASDILQRVLSVVPDDFVSQIGMSIIREDEGNMDAAIWHMERAYEVQPFNPAVQDELRRLYGRRDGIEPPKIRLTRGALVRMYARGELYPQAIAETRAALAEDPQRLDLRVLLARMYYLSGQKNDAAEVCSELIAKLPYCYEANRLLAEILPTTSRAEETPKFQQRIYALDPYEAFVSPSAPTSLQVPDQAVMVEQFLWEPGAEASQVPEWTRTVGVAWEEPEEENLPDWLNTLKPETPTKAQSAKQETALPTAETEPAAETDQQNDLVPDWMKEAGWAATDRSAEEIMAEQGETTEEELRPAEIPDWLQSMAPPEAVQAEAQEEERTEWLESIFSPASENGKQAGQVPPQAVENAASEPQAEETPDWLSNLDTGTSSEAAAADLPDWLSQAQETPSTEELQAAPTEEMPDWSKLGDVSSEAPAASFDDTADWLKSFGTETSEPGSAEESLPDWIMPGETPFPGGPAPEAKASEEAAAGEVPDWLSALAADTDQTETPEVPGIPEAMGAVASEAADSEAVASEFAAPEATISAAEEQPVELAGLPEWMQAEPEEPVQEVKPAAATDEFPPQPDLSDIDATMAWLEALAARQGADEATLITAPDQRTETMPDWVQKEVSEGESATQEQPAAEFSAFETNLPESALSEESSTETEPEAEMPVADLPEVDFPAAETQAEEPVDQFAMPEFSALEEEASAAEEAVLPDWLAEVEKPQEVQPAVPVEASTAESLTAGMPDLTDEAAALAWLESLAARQGADEATLITAPEERIDTPPDWVKKEMEQATEEQQAAHEQVAQEPVAQEPVSEFSEFDTKAAEFMAEEPVAEQPVVDESLAEEADLPDWLKAVAENQISAETAVSAETGVSEEAPVVLQEIEPVEEPAAEIPAPAQPKAEEAASVEAAMPDFSDMDAAMAWLESLAARQGADEATLVTPPDQRTDVMPDWVQKEAEQPEQISPIEAAPEALAAEENIPDWLTQETAPVELAAPEELVTPESIVAAQEPLEEAPTEVEMPTSVSEEILLPGEEFAQEFGDTLAQEEPSRAEEEMAPVSWLSETQPISTEQEEVRAEETPDWLQGLAEESTTTPAVEEPIQWGAELEPAAANENELPEWLKPAESAAQPTAAGEAEEFPEWLMGLEEEASATESQAAASTGEYRAAWEPEIAGEAEYDQMLSEPAAQPVQPVETPSSLLELQAALNRGELDQALDGYGRFIQNDEHLDEVIHDLRDALYRFPVDISVWQTLGDAYARNNQLQEALDAYTKAEELLR